MAILGFAELQNLDYAVILLIYYQYNLQAGPHDSLKDVALKILHKKVATIPIIHSSSQDGSFPQLLHIASLSGILKCKLLTCVLVKSMWLSINTWPKFSGICRHFRHSSSSLPILQQPICAIPLGTWVPKIGESNRRPLAMLRPNASLTAALSLLVQGDILLVPEYLL